MKLLLDTHTAIWFVTDSNQLPKSAKQLIENPENHCLISIATLWEMGIKYSLGKLKLKAELNKVFELFFESGLILMPITPDHILTNASMQFHHRDPFDSPEDSGLLKLNGKVIQLSLKIGNSKIMTLT